MLIFVVMLFTAVMIRLVIAHGEQIRLRAFHNGQEFPASQFLRRSRDNRRRRVQIPEEPDRFPDLLRIRLLRIRPAQNHRAAGLHLIFKEFAEVFQIHPAFQHIHHCRCGMHLHAGLSADSLHRPDDIRQLSHARRLDDDTVRVIGTGHFAERLSEVSDQRAADAAGIHLTDLHARLPQEASVDPDLTEFILNQHDLLVLQRLCQQFPDQGRLAGPEKAGYDIYLRHVRLRSGGP